MLHNLCVCVPPPCCVCVCTKTGDCAVSPSTAGGNFSQKWHHNLEYILFLSSTTHHPYRKHTAFPTETLSSYLLYHAAQTPTPPFPTTTPLNWSLFRLCVCGWRDGSCRGMQARAGWVEWDVAGGKRGSLLNEWMIPVETLKVCLLVNWWQCVYSVKPTTPEIKGKKDEKFLFFLVHFSVWNVKNHILKDFCC